MSSSSRKGKDSKNADFDILLEPIELVGRQNELNDIITTIQNDGDLLITGAPDSGRFTLVKQAAEEVNARLLRIDCLRSSNGQEFINLLIEGIYQSFNEEQWKLINQVLSKPNDNLTLFVFSSSSNKVTLSSNLDQRNQEKAFQLAVSSLQQLIDGIGGRVVIVLERFYKIRSWDRQSKWEEFLRTKVRTDSKVSYIILGTVAEANAEPISVVDDEKVDDEKITVIKLKPLARGILTAWAKQALRNHNLVFNLTDGALDLFLDTVQGHIGEARILIKYIVVLCRDSERPVSKDDVYRALSNLLEDFSVVFESLLLMLPYTQLQLLECLAVEPTRNPHGKDYIIKYGLARGGTLQSALKGLQQKGMIYGPEDKHSNDKDDKYQLTLPLFSHWLRENKLKKPSKH
jgi:hypothetical protein